MGKLNSHAKASLGNKSGSQVLSQEQIAKIQSVLLTIIKDVDSICRDNNLKYALIGGTAIGCLRNDGFIPWDDDVDIAMPRADYERFRQILSQQYGDKYKLTDSMRNNNYGKLVPKLRLLGTKYKTLLNVDSRDVEMNADIFIIENVPDNSLCYLLQGIVCSGMGFLLSCRRLALHKEHFRKIYKGKDFKIKVFVGTLLSFVSLEGLANITERCYSMCGNDSSMRVSLPADGLHYFKGTVNRNAICEVLDHQFETEVFCIPREYDKYLRSIYGDYMQVPPADKRYLSVYEEIDFGIYDQITASKKIEA